MSSSPSLFRPLASFPKVPKSPNTPNGAIDKRRFKLFSAISLLNLKAKGKDTAKASPVVPPEVVPQPHTLLCSLTAPYENIDEKLPPTSEVDVQFGSGVNNRYTTVTEKAPTPFSTASEFHTPHRPLPSVRSWDNLRVRETRKKSATTLDRTKTLPKSLVGEPDEFRMYHIGETQSAPALVVSPIQEEEPSVANLLPTCLLESYTNCTGLGPCQWEQSGVNLDNYPWYLSQTTGGPEWVYGLSPLATIRWVDKDYTGAL